MQIFKPSPKSRTRPARDKDTGVGTRGGGCTGCRRTGSGTRTATEREQEFGNDEERGRKCEGWGGRGTGKRGLGGWRENKGARERNWWLHHISLVVVECARCVGGGRVGEGVAAT